VYKRYRQTTDDRQTDGRAMTCSEFTFVNKKLKVYTNERWRIHRPYPYHYCYGKMSIKTYIFAL